eukprot:285479_1
MLVDFLDGASVLSVEDNVTLEVGHKHGVVAQREDLLVGGVRSAEGDARSDVPQHSTRRLVDGRETSLAVDDDGIGIEGCVGDREEVAEVGVGNMGRPSLDTSSVVAGQGAGVLLIVEEAAIVGHKIARVETSRELINLGAGAAIENTCL